jgi:hypothetical protein
MEMRIAQPINTTPSAIRYLLPVSNAEITWIVGLLLAQSARTVPVFPALRILTVVILNRKFVLQEFVSIVEHPVTALSSLQHSVQVILVLRVQMMLTVRDFHKNFAIWELVSSVKPILTARGSQRACVRRINVHSVLSMETARI